LITLMRVLLTTATLFISFDTFALSIISLQQGVNNIDLNNDGLTDYVLVAQYDNNKSHPSDTITFYVQKPEGGFSIVPSIVEGEFSYFSLSLSGSNVMISGLSLVRNGTVVYFTTADKSVISAYDKHPIHYSFYQLLENDDHPGVPLYQWYKVSSASSNQPYLSVEESFKELEKLSLVIQKISSD